MKIKDLLIIEGRKLKEQDVAFSAPGSPLPWAHQQPQISTLTPQQTQALASTQPGTAQQQAAPAAVQTAVGRPQPPGQTGPTGTQVVQQPQYTPQQMAHATAPMTPQQFQAMGFGQGTSDLWRDSFSENITGVLNCCLL